jgi:hypothetical protein
MDNVPTGVSAVRSDRTAWIKLLMGGGLGVVIAAGAVKYLMDEGSKDGDFLRTKVQENTTAMTKVVDSMEDVASELKGVAEELDGVKDEQQQLVNAFRPMARKFQEAAEAVTEQVEQRDAETKLETEPK